MSFADGDVVFFYLQHLDEGNTQVEVGQVTADQRQAEHDTDGHDSTTVREFQ
jgi:hypothetical protein